MCLGVLFLVLKTSGQKVSCPPPPDVMPPFTGLLSLALVDVDRGMLAHCTPCTDSSSQDPPSSRTFSKRCCELLLTLIHSSWEDGAVHRGSVNLGANFFDLSLFSESVQVWPWG